MQDKVNEYFMKRVFLESTTEFKDITLAEQIYKEQYAEEIAELEVLEKEIRDGILESYETPFGKFGYTPAKTKLVFDEEALTNLSAKYPEILDCRYEKESKPIVRLTMSK